MVHMGVRGAKPRDKLFLKERNFFAFTHQVLQHPSCEHMNPFSSMPEKLRRPQVVASKEQVCSHSLDFLDLVQVLLETICMLFV